MVTPGYAAAIESGVLRAETNVAARGCRARVALLRAARPQRLNVRCLRDTRPTSIDLSAAIRRDAARGKRTAALTPSNVPRNVSVRSCTCRYFILAAPIPALGIVSPANGYGKGTVVDPVCCRAIAMDREALLTPVQWGNAFAGTPDAAVLFSGKGLRANQTGHEYCYLQIS